MAAKTGQAAPGGKVETATEPEQIAGKSDDKCIGNRRFRTILLCIVLEAFCIFSDGYLWLHVEAAKDEADVLSSDAADSRVHGANFIFSGLMFCILFLFAVLIMVCIPSIDPSTNALARLPGAGLLLGAILYLLDWVWWITTDKEVRYHLMNHRELDSECTL